MYIETKGLKKSYGEGGSFGVGWHHGRYRAESVPKIPRTDLQTHTTHTLHASTAPRLRYLVAPWTGRIGCPK